MSYTNQIRAILADGMAHRNIDIASRIKHRTLNTQKLADALVRAGEAATFKFNSKVYFISPKDASR